MAVYRSKPYQRGNILRPENQTESAEASMTVTIPAGTALAINDLLYFAKLGENIDVQEVHCTFDAVDSNATAAAAGALGTVPSTTLKTQAAVVAVAGYNSIFTATVLGVNAGLAKNITRQAGGGTGDTFNTNPFPVAAVPVDLVLVVSAAPTTAITNVDRDMTVRVKYQMKHYNEIPASGVTDTRYPYAGSIVRADVPQYTPGG